MDLTPEERQRIYQEENGHLAVSRYALCADVVGMDSAQIVGHSETIECQVITYRWRVIQEQSLTAHVRHADSTFGCVSLVSAGEGLPGGSYAIAPAAVRHLSLIRRHVAS